MQTIIKSFDFINYLLILRESSSIKNMENEIIVNNILLDLQKRAM